jgi:hypothetical protein
LTDLLTMLAIAGAASIVLILIALIIEHYHYRDR